MLVYAASTLLTFAALSGSRDGPNALPDTGVHGRGRRLALAIGLLSLAGLPPAPGFWAKLAVLSAAWNEAGWLAATPAILGAVLGALYYMKPVPDLLAGAWRDGEPRPGERRDLDRGDAGSGLAMLGAGAAVLVFMVAPFLAYRLAL